MDSLKSEISALLAETGCSLAPGLSIDKFVDLIDHILSGKQYINLDFADIAAAIKNSSVVNIASATVPYDRIGSTISPMLRAKQPGRTLYDVIINLRVGPDFTIEHTKQLNEALNSCPYKINAIWGVSQVDTSNGETEISAIFGYF